MTTDKGGRPSEAQRLAAVHRRSMDAFSLAHSAQWPVRQQCIDDRRFLVIAGQMWGGALKEQFANRPRFEFNRLKRATRRVFSEYRNNRVQVMYRPKDEGSSSELAETLTGLYRADEHDSGAREAYDNCFDEAASGGIGAWRLRCIHEDESDTESEAQRVAFEPIFDADTSVYWEVGAKKADKSDARKCWVLTGMTNDGYEDEYGESPAPSSFPKPTYGGFTWWTAETICVAEYYEVEQEERELFVFEDTAGNIERVQKRKDKEEAQEDQQRIDVLRATGFTVKSRRAVKVPRVHKYIIDGARVIEDCGYIAGRCIPIVMQYGQRWVVDGVEWCEGMVRVCKDSARLFNMQMSRLAEIASLSTVEKPIVTPQQIAGHQNLWASDNIKNNPVLLLNPILDANGNPMPAGPIGYTKPPDVPPALAATIDTTGALMKEMLGDEDSAEQVQANTSGIAVDLVQKRLDMQAFLYMDAHASAMRRSGEIYYWMARDIYVEESRRLPTMNDQGDTEFVEIMRPMYDAQKNKTYLENDLSQGRFEAIVDVGPTFSSRKDSTVRSLVSMMQAVPQSDMELASVLASTALLNMDGEGLSDVQSYLRRRLIKQGVIKPNDEEAQQLQQEQQNTPPDPQAEYLRSAAQAEAAKAIKAQADTALAAANTERTQAETAKVLASIPIDHQRAAVESARAIADIAGQATKTIAP